MRKFLSQKVIIIQFFETQELCSEYIYIYIHTHTHTQSQKENKFCASAVHLSKTCNGKIIINILPLRTQV
jgi:hypothetical protein